MGALQPVTTEGNQGAEKQLRLPSCFFFWLCVYQDGQRIGNSFIRTPAHNSLDEEIICKLKDLLYF